MKLQMQNFGEIEIGEERFDHDLVIENGRIGMRSKKPSKPYRGKYGHTPLSVKEAIPWHGNTLYIGTGLYGRLPVMPEVYAEAKARSIEVVALPTPKICAILGEMKPKEINAILHVTC